MANFKYFQLLLLVALIAMITAIIPKIAYQYGLKMISSPSGCRGGEVCSTQPSLSVVDVKTLQIVYTFAGSVYVTLGATPTGYEQLYYGSGCDQSSCGQQVTGSLVSVVFKSGVATFQNLTFKAAGSYTLKFIGRLSSQYNEQVFAETFSAPFNVSVGAAYQLTFFNFIGNAFGGIPFSPNPGVAVADRGGNTVVSMPANTYSITASLSTTPTAVQAGDGQQLLPATLLSVPVVAGVAHFEQLYINKSGFPYQMTFSIDKIPLPSIKSIRFTVAVGHAAKLAYSDGQLSQFTKFSGEFFSVTPQIKLLDVGGNLVTFDNTSAIRVSINENPTGAVIDPLDSLFMVAKNGIVSFTNLRISTKGFNYTLLFELFNFSALTNQFENTYVSLVSEKFDVQFGPPRKLRIITSANNAWAGNEAFQTQPVLQLLDYGNNSLANNFTSVAQASLVPSLSVSRTIVIYTGDAPITHIKEVTINVMNGTYGAGQVLNFSVHFIYNVWVKAVNDSSFVKPTIGINVQNIINHNSISNATLVGPFSQSKVLVFQYVVQRNDSSSLLDFLHGTRINCNGYLISDGNGKEIDLTLPTKTITHSKQITIDTSPPVITLLNTSTLDGAYGEGQKIYISVQFNQPVVVVGIPFITLSVITSVPTAVPIATPTYSPSKFKPSPFPSLPYPSLNPTVTLDPTESPTLQPSIEPTESPTKEPVTTSPTQEPTESPSFDPTVHSGSWNPSSQPSSLPSRQPSSLPSNQPSQLPSSMPSTVPSIYPSYGGNNFAEAKYSYSSNDSTVLYFLYEVGRDHFIDPSSSTGFLDVADTFIKLSLRHESIKRKAENPTTTVDYNFNSLNLGAHKITIDSSPPMLNTAYGVQSDHLNGTYYSGEHIRFFIQFTKPVAVTGDGIYLLLNCGPNSVVPYFKGQAFIEKILPDNITLQFLYIVELNVNTLSNTEYRGLEIDSGGHALVISQATAYIRRLSDNPVTNADLSTDGVYNGGYSLRNRESLILIGYSPVVLSAAVQSTDPIGASILYPDDSIYIEIAFSAPVFLNCSPVLVMAVKYYREAIYISGNTTHSLLFRYTIQMGDMSDTSIAYRHTPYALCPESGCSPRSTCAVMANSTAPILPVNLKLFRSGTQPYYKYTPGVSIDLQVVKPFSQVRNTSIVEIRCLEDPGEYSVGSVIHFRVEYSDIIEIDTSVSKFTLPKLFLNIVNGTTYALYSYGSPGKTLIFTYIVGYNDVVISGSLSPDLITGSSTAVLCLQSQNCSLINQGLRVVDHTMTIAGVVVDSGITLDYSEPKVLNIWADKETSLYEGGDYTVGEQFLIYLNISKPILVTGFTPRILMDVGVSERYALYQTELSTPSLMVFKYTVGFGDFSTNLTYVEGSIDLYDGNCVIYRKTSLPQILMDTMLPSPPMGLGVDGNIIKINTTVVPTVISVTSVTTTGKYTVGDEIIFRIDFSHLIKVDGNPFLTLNLGDHTRNAVYIGSDLSTNNYNTSSHFNKTQNSSSSSLNAFNRPTTFIYLLYTVMKTDFSLRLDYVDEYSFHVGLTDNNEISTIRQASTNATIDANLKLPTPGNLGSLGYSKGGRLEVDARPPYITSLNFTTQSGTYGVNNSIIIEMNFSAPIFIDSNGGKGPSILLETGLVDGEALYLTGNLTTSILFEYKPEPGDYNNHLDYASERKLFSSAKHSFLFNGAKVFALSKNPSLPAFIWLNPPKGSLTGQLAQLAYEGEYTYTDLAITRRGPDYLIRYSTEYPPDNMTSTYLTTFQFIENSFSSEFLLRPAEALKGELIGNSVDIYGDIAVLGSPNSNRSVTTIQTVTSSALLEDPRMEVQMISTSVTPQTGIQTFHSSADVGEVVGGYFTVSYAIYGPSKPIPANANPDIFHSILAFSLPEIGNVTVKQEPYIYCACENAFTWTLIFNDLTEGPFQALDIDYSGLTGSGALVTNSIILQNSSQIAGTFTIGSGGVFGKESSPIPFDASAKTVTDAIAEIGLSAFEVQITPTQKSYSRSWLITFNAYLDSFMTLPLVSVNGSGLTGGDTYIYSKVVLPGIHGPNGIAGYFQLEWRGNITRKLLPTASAKDVKLALEELPVINFVNVNRSQPSRINGFTWTIEFVSVNIFTPRGYMKQDTSNVEPIKPINNLNATNISLVASAHWSLGQRYSVYDIAREGTYGDGAGAVYVFQRRNETWDQVATIMANDTVSDNSFGSSVSLIEDLLLVGSVGANVDGVPEKQAIHCHADSGFFKIMFRNWYTDAISYNVSRMELMDAIINTPGTFNHLYSVNNIDIDDWGSGPFCDNHTAVITFFSPVQGSSILFGVDNGPNLELLTLININLTRSNQNDSTSSSLLSVYEVQKGTWKVENTSSDFQQIGSAYIFRASYDCTIVEINSSVCWKTKWIQEAKLYPTQLQTNSRFGYSVSLSPDTAVIGAPGSNNERGMVYIYNYFPNELIVKWKLQQILTDPALVNGNHFGNSVAISGNTIIVGSPQDVNGNTGAVYVYKRSTATSFFSASQKLIPDINLYPLSPGNYFGNSVAIEGNMVVVGSCRYSDNTVYLGLGGVGNMATRKNVGAVFVFQRPSTVLDFTFDQKLVASNLRENDQFGFSIDLHGDKIVASTLESFSGSLTAAKTIVEIRTQAEYNQIPISGYFRIKWRTTNLTANGTTLLTRPIPFDTSDKKMKTILENDLLSVGNLIVSRSNVDVYDGGYSWLVTFIDLDVTVNLFESDSSRLEGTNAKVITRYINKSPDRLRGNAHVFQLDFNSYRFVEQVFTRPYRYQVNDRCGQAVAIFDTFSLMGCPNRDLIVPNQNSGAGFIFNLEILNIRFGQSSYSVLEGNNHTVDILHSSTNKQVVFGDALFYFQTLDRNANLTKQTFIQDLYGILSSSLVSPETVMDHSGLVGKAVGRSQFYGSFHRESIWVDGMFDYRGISDYVHVYRPHILLAEVKNVSEVVVTSPDTLYETPDEVFTQVLSSPGLWPGVYSKLVSQVTIRDDGDGVINGTMKYRKLYDSDGSLGDEMGSSISMNEQLGVLVSGAPLAMVNGRSHAGKVLLYSRGGEGEGVWIQQSSLSSPVPQLGGSLFGQVVVVTQIFDRPESLLVVSEPGINLVHLYVSKNPSNLGISYVLEQTFSNSLAFLPDHRYGESVGLFGYLLVIGSPGLECVFVHTRLFNESGRDWYWTTDAKQVFSSDHDYDVIYGVKHLHRQEFGKSISISDRTVAIGGPFADYDKLGTDLIETNWDTEGSSIFAFGRGKVYLLDSSPSIQQIRMTSLLNLNGGQFQLVLSNEGIHAVTDLLPFDVSDEDLTAALQRLPNIDRVSVSSNLFVRMEQDGGGVFFLSTWNITFVSNWQTPSLLQPLWFGYGCHNCSLFNSLPPNGTEQISVVHIQQVGELIEKQTVSSSDRRNGDRFGWSVALDGQQLLVGAPWSSSMTTTSWDFETGQLQGWSKTGDAFDYQPTYGDNPYLRPIYPATPGSDTVNNLRPNSRSVNLQGMFFIGTFEKRRRPEEEEGSTQGDRPIGTLSSEVFVIRGKTITFLIGGGCDVFQLFVELLIDGLSVSKQTGRCDEQMRRESFAVTDYFNRAAQIRLVDNSSGVWGHINVDDFRFDWDVHGSEGGGLTETPRSGSAYLFRRSSSSSSDWYQERKLIASDKRSDTFFGSCVALNNSRGIAIVGAPKAAYTGFYKEVPSVFPFANTSTGISNVAGLHFPVKDFNMPLFESSPRFIPQRSGASGMWKLQQSQESSSSDKSVLSVEVGAIYVFTKTHEQLSSSGSVLSPQNWHPGEHAKIVTLDAFTRDSFGTSIAITSSGVAAGAIGDKGGSVYWFDSRFTAIQFQKVEYFALEGTDRFATITLTRDLSIFSGPIVLEYATSDLTAKGVDKQKFDDCLLLPVQTRGSVGCGDYELSRGLVHIFGDDSTGAFTVRIMDDLCYERFVKFIQITLSVPGSSGLQSEVLSTTLRIDDNDFLSSEICSFV